MLKKLTVLILFAAIAFMGGVLVLQQQALAEDIQEGSVLEAEVNKNSYSFVMLIAIY